MADENVRELLVRVSATTELLRSNLVAAEREIARFESTTNQVTQRVGAAFVRAGEKVGGFSRDVAKLKAELDPAWGALQNFREQASLLNRALQEGAISQSLYAAKMREIVSETQRVRAGGAGIVKVSGQQKAGLQQLSYQISDVATQFASGTKPMQIFAQQSAQVLQAIQLSIGGTSKFAAFLGGPWGIALTAGVVALTPFIQKLFDTAGAADTATNALDALIKKRASSVEQQFQLNNAERGLNSLLEKRSALEADIAKRGVRNPATGQLQFVFKQQQELASVNAQIAEGRAALDRERVSRALGEGGARVGGYQTPRVAVSGGTSTGRSGGGSRRAPSRAATAPSSELSPEIQFRAEMSKFTEAQAEALAKVRDKDYEDSLELINRKADNEFEARREVLDRLRQQEANQIDFLAGIYEDAFRGGTNAIWSNFKNLGLAVISQVLAKFTLSKISGKGGFDLGSAFSSALTSILGFADGGRPPVGRVSMVGERGPELFVPDVAGTVVPNHMLGGGGGVSLTIHAPGATAETVAMIRRELANAAPALVAAASGNTIRALNRKSL